MTPINDIVMKSELKMYKLYRKPIKRLCGPFIAYAYMYEEWLILQHE